jgi:hypothetical protein
MPRVLRRDLCLLPLPMIEHRPDGPNLPNFLIQAERPWALHIHFLHPWLEIAL